jgi:outer membrane protein
MVRARAVNLNMANQDGTALHLTVNDKTIPEVDVSYFFTPNVAAELILTVPQKQTVSSAGASIGSFKHLPPTLFLQYHFTGLSGYKPYLGVGYNYTVISSSHLASPYTLDGHSTGAALQAGVDVPIDPHWSLNLDVKKVDLSTHVYGTSGADQGVLKLDPLVVGIGLGYRY